MRKIQFIGVFSLIFLLIGHSVLAAETKKVEFFGVGATVTELANQEFKVETTGEKEGEGFVHTPSAPTSINVKYKVALKGEGKVYLKIEETDARGTFLNEVKSEEIQLTDEWKEYELEAKIASLQSQLDVFVLTSSKQETTFFFKNVEVLNE
ncbi:hypothetical protein EKG37_16565 [Robertmurraya yapensis]|uniref:CBM-cenC domain-containing protein n=2 Tax=Bacillaceae TaxID=186817 RepID=A0A431VZV9_9BACI|nr:hypothetical protein [Bacillus yapensis]RTR28827.1 hypothetical protein EKG37_16565 [Bacillus yapensis]TKS94685.1 hypothetical protein FAR12_16565 [Bacillus yapensis]